MAKVIITIEDLEDENGKIAMRVSPSYAELMQKAAFDQSLVTGAEALAMNAIVKIRNEMKNNSPIISVNPGRILS